METITWQTLLVIHFEIKKIVTKTRKSKSFVVCTMYQNSCQYPLKITLAKISFFVLCTKIQLIKLQNFNGAAVCENHFMKTIFGRNSLMKYTLNFGLNGRGSLGIFFHLSLDCASFLGLFYVWLFWIRFFGWFLFCLLVGWGAFQYSG